MNNTYKIHNSLPCPGTRSRVDITEKEERRITKKRKMK